MKRVLAGALAVHRPGPGSGLHHLADRVRRAAVTLNGSGSTLSKPYQETAIEEFKKANKDVKINYGGGGSGKGRQDLADMVVDFAGTDAPYKEADLAKVKGGEVLYFPILLGPITVSYNVQGVDKLQLSAETHRQDLPARHQEVERQGDRRRQPGREAARRRHRRRPPRRRLGHHPELHRST